MTIQFDRPMGVPRAALVSSLLLVGCAASHPLMPTPNLYELEGAYPASEVPAAVRTNRVDLLYVTDRSSETDELGRLGYGSGRSASAAFGSVIVEIGEATAWEDLVEASETRRREEKLDVRLQSIVELGRFPETPRPFSVQDGAIVEDAEIREKLDRAEAEFLRELDRRLVSSDDRDVFVYVHGFNNSFEDTALNEAEIWHFLGRRGVPVVYSWPAAHGGLLGYFIDRESGEFTIYHLKELLRLLGRSREVERIHILAHSRGTDVTTTALRELVIETRAAGKDPRTHLRIENLVLAAADLDLDVVRQRLMAERFGPAFGQITIYTNQADKALSASQTLMSGTRFGRVKESDLGRREHRIFTEVTNVNIIEVEGVESMIGHAYYRTSPAASSDVILTLRDGLRPGEPGRPLVHKMLNFWKMPEDYPNVRRLEHHDDPEPDHE